MSTNTGIPVLIAHLGERVAILQECTTQGETEQDRKSAELALKEVRLTLTQMNEKVERVKNQIKKAA